MRRFVPGLALVLLLSLPAPAAFAVDGVLEINQASVAAGGGFPLSITQSGSYRLTSNLVISTSIGIGATVDDVRLDLNGFSLIGPGSCTPIINGTGKLTSVTCSGLSGTAVSGVASLSNGTIRGFITGIAGSAGRALELDRMVVAENGTGLVTGISGSVLVTNSRFSRHSGVGLDAQSAGGSTVVRNSTFEQNGNRGLYLAAGVASHSNFHQNKNEGIRSNAGRAAVVESCYFEDNGYGIFGNANVGYRGSVFLDNTTNVSSNPLQLGDNLCDGALCP